MSAGSTWLLVKMAVCLAVMAVRHDPIPVTVIAG